MISIFKKQKSFSSPYPIKCLLLTIVFLSFFNIAHSQNKPQIIEGTLDLKNWNFSEDGVVGLSGNWNFYWSEHLPPDRIKSSLESGDFSHVQVPGSWNNHLVDGQKISGSGYATYHLKVMLNDKEERLSLKLLDMATSYTLYLNGKIADRVGSPGKSPEKTTPFYHPKVIEFANNADSLDIVVHVSNFDHWQGGMWEIILLGTPDQLRSARENKLGVMFILFGGISIIGIYHFFLFGFRPQDKSTLFFGIFCLLIVIRIFFTGERYAVHLFPEMSFEVLSRTIYLSFYLCVPVFAMYLGHIFPKEASGNVIKVLQGAGLSFSIFTLLMPSRIYTYAMPVYQDLTILVLVYGIWVIFKAVQKKRKGALICAISMVALFLTVGNDILYTRQIINTWHIVPFGLLFFIICQAILISQKFSMAFSLVEKQHRDLLLSNDVYKEELITRKKTQASLEKSEKQYRSLIEQSSDGICIIQNQTIQYYNSAFLKLTGESGEELINQSFLKYIDDSDRKKVLQLHQQRLSGKSTPGRYTIRGVNAKGKTYDLELDAALAEWHEKPSVLVFVRDITEHKKTQEILIQSEKMISIGGLAAGMAHEINNPLAGMVQNADLLNHRLTNLENPGNQKTAQELGINLADIKIFMEKRDIFKMVTAIRESGQRVVDIINNMLNFARKSDSSFSTVEPGLMLDKSLELAMTDFNLKKKYGFKKIEIIKNYEKDIPMLLCERTKIQQVLLNVFKNGAYAMQRKSENDKNYCPAFTLRLFKKTDTDMICIEIEDNGPGMDEKTKKRIFEPFFTTKPVGEGTGLGLSVSYFIITKNHGGTMSVVSDPGKRTCFIIGLPLQN